MKFFTTITLLVALLAILSFPQSSSASSNSLDCSLCTYVLSYVEDFVQENKTLAEIEDGLDIACSILPTNWKSGCDVMVNSYAPLMVKMIINKENPQTVCAQVKICNTSSIATTTAEKEAKNFYKQIKEKKVVQKKVGASGLECDLCDYVLGYIENYVSNNATESQVLQFLDNDCKILRNDEWVSECQTLVNDYAPLIIQYLENKEPPATICSQIKLCPTNGKSSKPCGEKFKHNGAVKVGNEECAICTFVVSYAEQFLAENKTLGPIEELLEKECDKFLPKYAATCNAAIQNYLPEIIQYIENGETPSQICQTLKLCTAPSSKKSTPTSNEFIKFDKEDRKRHHAIKKVIHKQAVQKLQQSQGGDLCSICEIVVQDAVRYLANNATDQEVLAFIENDCTYFRNQQFVQECQSFVGTYGQLVIKYVTSNPNPETTCTNLHLCSNDSSDSTDSVVINTKAQKPSRPIKLN